LFADTGHRYSPSKAWIKYRYSMKTTTTRLCVYPKDVQRITGKSERYGRMLLLKIRESINKQDHQFISIEITVVVSGHIVINAVRRAIFFVGASPQSGHGKKYQKWVELRSEFHKRGLFYAFG
jgi:hypothetical protein